MTYPDFFNSVQSLQSLQPRQVADLLAVAIRLDDADRASYWDEIVAIDRQDAEDVGTPEERRAALQRFLDQEAQRVIHVRSDMRSSEEAKDRAQERPRLDTLLP